jgi:redox-sensitive bicupin YhaK (pirin superfamily)
MAEFDTNKEVNYRLNLTSNGIYIFVIEGQISVGKESLEKRDGFGIWNTENINISALKGTKILLMEVPMSV